MYLQKKIIGSGPRPAVGLSLRAPSGCGNSKNNKKKNGALLSQLFLIGLAR